VSSGRFTAVVHGTWEADARVPVIPAAVVLLACAFTGWLLTVLLVLAIAAAAVLAVLGVACWLLLRRNDRDSELLAERSAALHAEVTAHAVTAAAPAPVVNHYHLHLPPGATAEGAGWAIPERDAITTEEAS
jgi:hypothetical protein